MFSASGESWPMQESTAIEPGKSCNCVAFSSIKIMSNVTWHIPNLPKVRVVWWVNIYHKNNFRLSGFELTDKRFRDFSSVVEGHLNSMGNVYEISPRNPDDWQYKYDFVAYCDTEDEKREIHRKMAQGVPIIEFGEMTPV